ncbi:MAG: hypothetical protein JWP97_1493 [Labilithrix sp.]|nr:hypothetical protein [Labilithrix sp.]
MGRFHVGLVALVTLVSAACSAAPAADSAAASDEDLTAATAAIAFAGGKASPSLTGAIFEGETVKITYAPERMTSCTKGDGDPHHGPQFDYTLFYSWHTTTGEGFRSKLVANSNGASSMELTAPFHATDLEIYVQLTNPRGCSEYDSAGGANFHFPVGKARLPVIHFEKDGAVTTGGTLRAGTDLLVDYASLRLESCNQSGRRLTMFGRVDGAALPPQELAEESRYGRTIGRLHPAPGGKQLELWFETVDFHACTQWDSAGGANFQFTLE